MLHILPSFIKLALLNSTTTESLKYLLCRSFNQATCGGTLSTILIELGNLLETKYDTKFLPMNPHPENK